MSITDTAKFEPPDTSTAPRRPWRAPAVIEARECPMTAKTNPQPTEAHGLLSTTTFS